MAKVETANEMIMIGDGLSNRVRLAKALLEDIDPLLRWLFFASFAISLPIFYLEFLLNFLEASAELSDRVRWSGLLFQLFGLAEVVRGLNKSRQLFDRTSLWRAAGELGKRMGKKLTHIINPPEPVSATGHVQAGAVAGAGFGAVVTVAPHGSVEDRIAKLENEVGRLEKCLSDVSRDVVSVRTETRERIDRERSERQAGDRGVSKQLETATIGGIHIEIAGLVYLYVGILFTSLPREVAYLLQKIGVL